MNARIVLLYVDNLLTRALNALTHFQAPGFRRNSRRASPVKSYFGSKFGQDASCLARSASEIQACFHLTRCLRIHLTRCLRTLRARPLVAARGAREGLWLEQLTHAARAAASQLNFQPLCGRARRALVRARLAGLTSIVQDRANEVMAKCIRARLVHQKFDIESNVRAKRYDSKNRGRASPVKFDIELRVKLMIHCRIFDIKSHFSSKQSNTIKIGKLVLTEQFLPNGLGPSFFTSEDVAMTGKTRPK